MDSKYCCPFYKCSPVSAHIPDSPTSHFFQGLVTRSSFLVLMRDFLQANDKVKVGLLEFSQVDGFHLPSHRALSRHPWDVMDPHPVFCYTFTNEYLLSAEQKARWVSIWFLVAGLFQGLRCWLPSSLLWNNQPQQ